MNPIKKLARLFKSNPKNNFLAELYSKTSKPLLVHPHIGQALLDSYLITAKSADLMNHSDDDGSGSSVFVTKHEGVAVMDICGSLTDREMNVPCMASPVSYEAIKYEMQVLLADESINTIVARLDTPGGVASQNMDLSDFIYASRGQGTKLIACVDDMAYSAGFGIASAFEEIWITRTGGVGSVGVVSMHIDQSKELAKKGIKVEYIYAGDNKIFGNPTEALSDKARDNFQLEVNRLYTIFTSTVARNLGLSVDVVVATQAGTFHGQQAIDIGFAHKLGTFDNLMSELMTMMPSDDEDKDKMMPSDDEDKDKMLDVTLSDSGEKPLAEITEDPVTEVTLTDGESGENDEVIVTEEDDTVQKLQEKRIQQEALDTYKASVKSLCMVAGVESNVADTYIDAKMSIVNVRDNLLLLTESDTEVVTVKSLNRVDNAQKQIDNSWNKAFNLKEL